MKKKQWISLVIGMLLGLCGCSEKPQEIYLNGQALIVDTQSEILNVIGSSASDYGRHTYYPKKGQILVENKYVKFDFSVPNSIFESYTDCSNPRPPQYREDMGTVEYPVDLYEYKDVKIAVIVHPVNIAFAKAKYGDKHEQKIASQLKGKIDAIDTKKLYITWILGDS